MVCWLIFLYFPIDFFPMRYSRNLMLLLGLVLISSSWVRYFRLDYSLLVASRRMNGIEFVNNAPEEKNDAAVFFLFYVENVR